LSLCLISSNPKDELELKRLFFISQELKKRGHRFFIITNQGNRLSSQARLQGYPVVNHRLGGRVGWISDWKLSRFLKKHEVKLVHFFDREALEYSFKAVNKANVPIRLTYWKPVWSWPQKRVLLNQLEAVVCDSEEAKRVLLNSNLSARLEVIPPGIDFSQVKSLGKKDFLRRELNLSSESFLAGLLTPLEELKTLKSHLEAIRSLNEEAPRLKIVVLGKGSLNLEKLRQEQPLELDNLYFYLGYDELIKEAIASLDLLVFGSFSMPQELLLEAMVWKVPVVGVMAAGMTELIVHRETGFLVPPNDPPALAQTILKLYLDLSLAQTLTEQAYALVSSKHSCEAMAEKMANFYEFLALQKGVKIGR